MRCCKWRSPLWIIAAIALALSQAAAQAPLFQDGFEGANGTLPSSWRVARAEDRPGWNIQDSKLNSQSLEGSEGLNLLLAETADSDRWRNVEVSTDFQMHNEIGQVALAVRYQDGKNYYAAILQSFKRPGSSDVNSQMEIVKFESGVPVSLGIALSPQDVALPPFHHRSAGDAPAKFAFRATNENLAAMINGIAVLEAKDASLRTGTAGIGQAFNSVTFDNLSVRASDGTNGLGERREIVVADSAAIPPPPAMPTSTPVAIPGLTDPSAGASTDLYYLIIIDHTDKESIADQMLLDLANEPTVKKIRHPDGTFSIEMGPLNSLQEAEATRDRLLASGGFLVQDIRRESSAAATPAPRPTSTPTEVRTPAPDNRRAELDRIRAAAERAELERRWEEAKGLWSLMMEVAGEGPDYEFAKANRDRVVALLPGQRTTTEDEPSGISSTVIIVVIAVIAVLGIGLIFVILRNKKKGEELRRRVEQLSAAPPTSPAAPAAPAQSTSPTPVAVPMTPSQMVAVGAQDRIRPGTMSPAPGQRQPTPQRPGEAQQRPAATPPTPRQPAASQQTPQRPAATPPTPVRPATPLRPGAPVTPPKPAAAAESSEPETLKLDFLFDESAKPPVDAAGQGVAIPDLHVRREPSTEFIIPPQPDAAPGTPPTAPVEAVPIAAPVAAPVSTDRNVYYTQNFDDEASGQMPRNWRGQYDYAALTIVEENNGGAVRKCLKFEKKNGVGSAYYSCKFPDATGRIGVEFDIRCDDKNKYLLGFYIEKDEDFRQSIHTIVHRTNSSANPTLRIQNESTPYEFGKWTHIKFEIDLPRHLIDGYADGKPIAMGVRLNSAPKAINTLSIRDNLATTGVLLIDNIRIYRL